MIYPLKMVILVIDHSFVMFCVCLPEGTPQSTARCVQDGVLMRFTSYSRVSNPEPTFGGATNRYKIINSQEMDA